MNVEIFPCLQISSMDGLSCLFKNKKGYSYSWTMWLDMGMETFAN